MYDFAEWLYGEYPEHDHPANGWEVVLTLVYGETEAIRILPQLLEPFCVEKSKRPISRRK